MTVFNDPPPLRTGPAPGHPVEGPVADSAPAEDGALQFASRPGLPALLVRNMLFGFLTLGIYRFWAKTNLRRFFWASVGIGGEPLEYTGRARELLIGFLIVMAIFVPLSVGYSALQTMLLDNAVAAGILSLAYALVLYLLINAATWRARRYRLARTLWRGIRAGQDGSTWAYIGKAALWLLLVPLSLGLAMPWALADLARYRIVHTTWGQFRGTFSGTGRGLLRPWLLVMALLVLPLLVCLAGAVLQAGWSTLSPAAGPQQLAGATARAGGWLSAALLLTVLAGPVLYGYFLVRWQRWYVGHTRIGPLHFTSSLRLRDLFLYGILLVILPIAFLAAITVAGVVAVQATEEFSKLLAGILIVVFALLALGGLRVLVMLTVYTPVLRTVITAITVENVAAAAEAQQSLQPQMRFGEGLADSFEIGIV